MLNSFSIHLMAVFLGGGCGALFRWLLSLKLNPARPWIQLGTLAANLSGALIIGLMAAFLAAKPGWPPEVRLFCLTGLLGGLTTFSTFSWEVIELLERGHIGPGLLTVALNLIGSLGLTAIGLLLGRLLFSPGQ